MSHPAALAHTALCELDLATTMARNLHRALTERQLTARLSTTMACIAAARVAATAAGLLGILRDCTALESSIRAALVDSNTATTVAA